MVFQKHDLIVLQQFSESFAFVHGFGQARVMVVIRDAVVEKRSGLAGGKQPVVFQHIECRGPRLVGVQHHLGAGDAVQRSVYALG